VVRGLTSRSHVNDPHGPAHALAASPSCGAQNPRQIDNQSIGTHYVAVTAFGANEVERRYSNLVAEAID
jgi:hypothetical protein